MNTVNIKHLLTIQRDETIFSVIGRMEILIQYCKEIKRYHHLIPFLEAYVHITKQVAKKMVIHKHFFADTKLLQEIDIRFAKTYFEPMLVYIKTGRKMKPWVTYLTYSEKKHAIPFVSMLLGINAHINSDLCTTLVSMKYKQKKDFFIINDILLDALSEVLEFLVIREHDFLSLGGIGLRKFSRKEYRKTVGAWRTQTYKNAQKIMKKGVPNYKSTLHDQTERMAEDIVDLIEGALHLHGLTHFTNDINKLRVRI